MSTNHPRIPTPIAETAPELTGRTVLVTGGAGFIGSRLATALAGRNEVRVLDDLSTGAAERVPSEATLVEGDVCDDEALARAARDVDVVFHLAATASVERSLADPLGTHRDNALGAMAVLERARDAGARVVLASSSAVYGQPETTPIAEDHDLGPTSPYGASKATADRYARLYADLYGLETVVLRYFNVYGDRPTGVGGVVSTFLRRALADEALTIHGDGTQTRDFVHVADVVRANLLAATTDRTGEAFNVGTGDPVTIARLADLVREVTDSAAPVVERDPRPGDIYRSCADVSKARRALGFEPDVTLRDGIGALADAARVDR